MSKYDNVFEPFRSVYLACGGSVACVDDIDRYAFIFALVFSMTAGIIIYKLLHFLFR